MQSREFVTTSDLRRHTVIIKPDPRRIQPIQPVAVPEGGSTLLFILAALTAIAWAATKRYCERDGGSATSTQIAR